MTLVREAGRAAVPLPLAESFLAGWLLEGAGLEVPEGPLTVAPVAPADALFIEQAAGGWILNGNATIPWGAQAGHIAVVAEAEAEAGDQVALVEVGRTRTTGGQNLAGEPRDAVIFDNIVLPADDVRPAGNQVSRAGLFRLGALARSVQIAGALDAVLAMTLAYVGDRVQFGRPLAKFQAVQQQLAVLAGQVAAAGRAADWAVAAAEAAEAGEGAEAIAAAKARAGEAAGVAAEICHQLHGAIGFTREYSLQHLSRRLWAWRDEFGPEVVWQRELGRLAAKSGPEGLWPFITGTG
jgi:alkylation response protein AidB-like acyl-CoA dehydrogenase